ncbi:hypothetical protein [Gorillibacterium sp. sgz500922]|uniref:hypothetical protein n=1 Tax=Gorillibacterium sp. sgz500922 TaxID=3446694 RepID=UPI003F6719A8
MPTDAQENDVGRPGGRHAANGGLRERRPRSRPSGWNNPMATPVFREQETKKHRVEIKMGIGSEQKDFSILAIGIVK